MVLSQGIISLVARVSGEVFEADFNRHISILNINIQTLILKSKKENCHSKNKFQYNVYDMVMSWSLSR